MFDTRRRYVRRSGAHQLVQVYFLIVFLFLSTQQAHEQWMCMSCTRIRTPSKIIESLCFALVEIIINYKLVYIKVTLHVNL